MQCVTVGVKKAYPPLVQKPASCPFRRRAASRTRTERHHRSWSPRQGHGVSLQEDDNTAFSAGQLFGRRP
jgi:hypothetical protein